MGDEDSAIHLLAAHCGVVAFLALSLDSTAVHLLLPRSMLRSLLLGERVLLLKHERRASREARSGEVRRGQASARSLAVLYYGRIEGNSTREIDCGFKVGNARDTPLTNSVHFNSMPEKFTPNYRAQVRGKAMILG